MSDQVPTFPCPKCGALGTLRRVPKQHLGELDLVECSSCRNDSTPEQVLEARELSATDAGAAVSLAFRHRLGGRA